MTAAAARALLAEAQALLLDFDGPVCSVFQGFPAHLVADQLRDLLTQGGHHALPGDVHDSPDPFDVLGYAATLGPDEVDHLEAAFRAYEVEAVQLAKPTPGAHELIHAWKTAGRPLAIVSNNSTAAIEVYLARFALTDLVDYVSARSFSDPALLKPAPYLVSNALAQLQCPASNAVLLGDSVADIEAAHMAGAQSIGYANRPDKNADFAGQGVGAIVSSLSDLLVVA